jgi:hypothetical protein
MLALLAVLLPTPVVELAKKLKPLVCFSGQDLVKHSPVLDARKGGAFHQKSAIARGQNGRLGMKS